MLGTTAGVTAVAVLAAAAGVTVLARDAWRGRVGGPTVAFAVGVAAGIVVVGLVLGRLAGVGVFGSVHLLYLAIVFTVPVVGAAVVVAGVFGRVGTGLALVGALLTLPAPVGFYATHVAPFRLRVDHVMVPLDPHRAGESTVRVAVLSDIQTTGVGEHERAAFAAVMNAQPDIILIPGDLFQARYRRLMEEGPELRRLLAGLDAPGGVYFVQGDVDRDDRMAVLLEDTGIEVLHDRVVRFRVRDRAVVLGGTRRNHASARADAVRRELVEAAGRGEVTILMSHRPDTVLHLPERAGIDLTVAGHTHGGQIALPGIGPLVTLSDVPRAVGAGGLHEVDGNRIYVSTGVGMERGQAPQVRFRVPPSVGVLDLG